MVGPVDSTSDPRWVEFKENLERTWGALSEDKLEQFKSEQGKLERYIHRQTGKDLEGIQLRVEMLRKTSDYVFEG